MAQFTTKIVIKGAEINRLKGRFCSCMTVSICATVHDVNNGSRSSMALKKTECDSKSIL